MRNFIKCLKYLQCKQKILLTNINTFNLNLGKLKSALTTNKQTDFSTLFYGFKIYKEQSIYVFSINKI